MIGLRQTKINQEYLVCTRALANQKISLWGKKKKSTEIKKKKKRIKEKGWQNDGAREGTNRLNISMDEALVMENLQGFNTLITN